MDAWPSGKHSNLDPESSGSPGRLRPTANSNQSVANPRPLPATPRQSVLLSLSPSQRKPRPLTSQWPPRPLQDPAAIPLGPKARTAGWDQSGSGHSAVFCCVSQIRKNLQGGVFRPSVHVYLSPANAARWAQCRCNAELLTAEDETLNVEKRTVTVASSRPRAPPSPEFQGSLKATKQAYEGLAALAQDRSLELLTTPGDCRAGVSTLQLLILLHMRGHSCSGCSFTGKDIGIPKYIPDIRRTLVGWAS